MNSREAIEVVAKEVNMPDLWERIKNMGKIRTDYVDGMGVESKEVAKEDDKGYMSDKMQDMMGELDKMESDQAGMVRMLAETVAQVTDSEVRNQLEEIISGMQSVLSESEESEDEMEMMKPEVEEKMLLSEPRTPNYEGTEDVSWGDVDKTLENYVAGYVKFNPDAEQPEEGVEEAWATVGSLPQPVRNWIAAKSFLGNPDAETFDDMLFFPVVNPNTNNLNRGALMAVVGGRGAQADIPEDLYEQVTEVAYGLLESEFDFMRDEEKMEQEVVEVEAKEEKEIDVEEIAEALQLKDLGVLLEDHEKAIVENNARVDDLIEGVKENNEGLKAIEALLEAIDELVEKQKEMFGRLEKLEHKSVELEKADEEKIAEKQNRFTPFWASRYQASKAAETVLSNEDAKQYNKPEVPKIIQDMTDRRFGGGK